MPCTASGTPHEGSHRPAYLDSHHEKWEQRDDGHIESDWKLCLYVAAESHIDFASDDSLLHLFECLHSFLFKERVYSRPYRFERSTRLRFRARQSFTLPHSVLAHSSFLATANTISSGRDIGSNQSQRKSRHGVRLRKALRNPLAHETAPPNSPLRIVPPAAREERSA